MAGAIFSGIAMAILLLGGLRRGYRLEHYIKPEHFDLLAKLMLGMSLVMTFVYATEFFMAFYRGSETESEVFRWRATGTYAPVFWLVVVCNSVAPLALFWKGVRRSLPTLIALSVLVTIGMWFERFMFIVTTLAHGYDPQRLAQLHADAARGVHLSRRLRLFLDAVLALHQDSSPPCRSPRPCKGSTQPARRRRGIRRRARVTHAT